MHCASDAHSQLRSQLERTPSLNIWGGAPHSQLPNPYVAGTCNANIPKSYDLVPLHHELPNSIPSSNATILTSSALFTLSSMMVPRHHVILSPWDALHLPPSICHTCTCTNLTQTSTTCTAWHHCTGFSLERHDVTVPWRPRPSKPCHGQRDTLQWSEVL